MTGTGSSFDGTGPITKEVMADIVRYCESERATGKYPEFVAEGERLAAEFRKEFPEVSDRDLATMLVVIVRVVSVIAQTQLLQSGVAMDDTMSSYTHAAGVLFKSVLEIGSL